MGRLNPARVILGGVLGGLAAFVLDGVLHGVVLKADWAAIAAAMGKSPEGGGSGMGHFLVYDGLKGIMTAWVYAAIRTRFGPGPRTAVVAGLAAWALVVPIALLGLLPMGWFGTAFAVKWSLFGTVPMIAAALVAGALYKEEEPEGAAAPR